MLEKISYEKEENTIWLMVNDNVAGHIEISEDCIEYIEINKEFQGKGFYKSLIFHALEMSGLDSLRSNNRNSCSNTAWEKWTGEELQYSDECFVCIDDDEKGLFFTKGNN